MAIYLGSNQVDLGLYNIQSDWAETDTTKESYIQNKPSIIPAVELTQSQYDALSTAEKNNGNVYYVTDSTGTYITASEVSYGSGSVQTALDGAFKFLGNNPISDISDDTYDSWYALGSGYCYINIGYLTHGHPSTSGFLLNLVSEIGTVTQIWLTRANGTIYRRSCQVVGDPMPDWRLDGGVAVVDVASFSSLPQTITNSKITADMVCVKAELGTPSAQTSDWTVTTSYQSLTISGSISGSTTCKLYLETSETI